MKAKTSEQRVQITQRVNWTLYKKIVAAAQRNKRSISAELELRIEHSFRDEGVAA